ncbi:MAG: hypothetical protein M3076_16465 [Actinomycetota bacterium]|nr:hypothetical protein [Actinomycetota bacterium]
MVPLERVLVRPGAAVPGFPLPELKPDAPPDPSAREPLAFKVVDVMTRQVLSEGIDARAAVAALEGVRSIVDATVYVREPGTTRWRLLTLAETKVLWDLRGTNAED